MKPRQLPWKWLLLGLFVFLILALAVLPRLAGNSSELLDRVAAALSDWTGATVTLTEPLTVQYFPPLSLHGGLVVTDATELPLIKSVTARNVEISLSLSDLLMGRIGVSAVRLSQPKITLKDAAASSDQTLRALVANALLGAAVDVIRIDRGTVTTSSGDTVISKLEARFDAGGDGAMSALGSFDFRGETVGFAIDSAEISETETGMTAPVTLRLTSAPVTVEFDGTASLGDVLQLDGSMQTEMGDVRRFVNWMGIALPEGDSLRQLTAVGTVHWNGATLTFENGTFALDGNGADGLLAITMGERPRVEGTLAFEHLVLDPYVGLGKTDEAPPSEASLFDWALLKYFDADLRVSATELSASTLKLGHGGFTITAKQGAISSEIGELELCGGQAAARIALDLSEPRTRASLIGTFADVAIDGCLAPFAPGVPFEGAGNIKIDVSTGGTTVDELIRGVAGSLKIEAQNGAVPVDLSRLLAEDAASEGNGWSGDAPTPFESLNADCRLSAGHIWCQLFTMQTRRGLISGSGDVDLGRRTLDWDFLIANPVAPLNTSQLVMETPPRLTIRGSLAEPLIRRADRPTLGDGSTQTNPVSPR